MTELCCPSCGHPLRATRLGVRLTPLKGCIFDASKRAGTDGIDGDVLFWLACRDRRAKRTSVKEAHVKQINELLTDPGYVIKGERCNGGRYTLVQTIARAA